MGNDHSRKPLLPIFKHLEKVSIEELEEVYNRYRRKFKSPPFLTRQMYSDIFFGEDKVEKKVDPNDADNYALKERQRKDDFLANKKLPKHQGGSAWSGELQDFDHSFLLFFARFISHFCAPGFFYTMGIGMVLFTKSRLLKKKWSKFKIVKHFLIRGFVLLIVGRLVDIAIIFQVIPIIIDHKPFPIEKILGS